MVSCPVSLISFNKKFWKVRNHETKKNDPNGAGSQLTKEEKKKENGTNGKYRY
jgi:hypothetical protein